MKKINSIKQLQAQKNLIKQQQVMLEKEIGDKWKALKTSLTPVNIAGDALSKIIKSKTEGNLNGRNILKNIFTYGITLMAGQLVNKAGEKLAKSFKK